MPYSASIVPDRDNLDKLLALMAECNKYSIFSLIAELGKAEISKRYTDYIVMSTRLIMLHFTTKLSYLVLSVLNPAFTSGV